MGFICCWVCEIQENIFAAYIYLFIFLVFGTKLQKMLIMFNALKTNESFKMHKHVKMNMKTNHTKLLV